MLIGVRLVDGIGFVYVVFLLFVESKMI